MRNSSTRGRVARRAFAASGALALTLGGAGIATGAERNVVKEQTAAPAAFCAVQQDSTLRCYSTEEAAYRAAAELSVTPSETGVRNKNDCPDAYLCLWNNANFVTSEGMRKYVKDGRHNLAADNADDWANSVFNRREGAVGLYDEECRIPVSPGVTRPAMLALPGGSSIDQLSNTPQPDLCGGGSWNNKIDRIEI